MNHKTLHRRDAILGLGGLAITLSLGCTGNKPTQPAPPSSPAPPPEAPSPIIERAEQLAAEKKDIAEQEKELFAEAKGRGYDTKVMRKVIALRKRKPDEIAEEEAVLEMYKSALGMG